MKASYLGALIVSLFGFYLLFFGVSDSEHVSLLGILLHSCVVKGIGLISLLIGTIAFMVAYGSSLPPRRIERSQ